ncbi:hypothetical protein [Hymenobacter swuensis]|uniref:Uncharacterized protein n=1 Tax=Hymenobacter swuensis DY53 TaxID=1227739 RepID=W8F2X7_9BACT|nr:hypothetical protein [Hymenobacter swuensis]AHJ96911.1 hypothetical protein Hsw_1316 [Hymenobacter swuensis DY53]
MKIREFLFGKLVYVQDKVVGQLQWIATDRKSAGYFKGACTFGPTGHTLDISFDAPRTGPTAAQKVFYHAIETHYPQLADLAQVLIVAEFRNWEPGFTVHDFQAEFWPVGLHIPLLTENQPVGWELFFETHHDPNHTVTVLWRNFDPYFVRIDG